MKKMLKEILQAEIANIGSSRVLEKELANWNRAEKEKLAKANKKNLVKKSNRLED